jgi:IPT/TIG domain
VFDVTEGSSGTCTPPATHKYFCTAEVGYDGPTGLGTPDGVPSSASVRVTGLEPADGPLAGGATVTITGKNLTGAVGVTFGSSEAASFTVESDSRISAVTPPGTGTVDVRVSTGEDTSGIVEADRYTYAPPPIVKKLSVKKGTPAGGTPLTIKGSGFTESSIVRFAGVQASSVTFESASLLSVTSPPGIAGPADVTVTTLDGTSAISGSDRFKYGAPTITKVSPGSGPATGGTSLTIEGAGFAPGTGNTVFTFRGTASGSVQCGTTTQCTVVAPGAKAGTIDVRAQVGRAKSKKTPPDDQFTYDS